MKKNKTVKKWHNFTFGLFRPFFRIHLKLKMNYTAQPAKLKRGEPALIFSNHQTFNDQFLVGVSFKEPVYMLATELLFQLGFVSKVIKFLVSPICKKKSMADVACIRQCRRVHAEGGKILVFVEGNCTYTGRPGTVSLAGAKLAKMLKAPLVLYSLRGGYGTMPRWAKGVRKGKMTGGIVEILRPEDYADMTPEQLSAKINSAIFPDELHPSVDFRSNRRAEYLEKLLYYCPDCGKYSTLRSSGNDITCTACGETRTYTERLTFEGSSPIHNVAEWYDVQITALFRDLGGFCDKIFEDGDQKLYVFGKSKMKLLGKGGVNMTREKLNACGMSFDLSAIDAMTVQKNSSLIFYVGQTTYYLKGRGRYNPVKYMHAYYMLRHCDPDLPVTQQFIGL